MNGTNMNELRAQCAQLDEAGQRVFVRELVMHTNVALGEHMAEEIEVKQKMCEVHRAVFDPETGTKAMLKRVNDALFDPDVGLVHWKKWMCRIFTWIGVVVGSLWALTVGAVAIGHNLGWW
jgi:nitrite reductase/ring-hydroxylating ferredoxin subunit